MGVAEISSNVPMPSVDDLVDSVVEVLDFFGLGAVMCLGVTAGAYILTLFAGLTVDPESLKECLRSHAASLGSYATDGCGEFTLDDTTTSIRAPTFGSGGGFGASRSHAFGSSTTSGFGASSTPAFGSSSTPLFGASSSAFGASSSPSFSFDPVLPLGKPILRLVAVPLEQLHLPLELRVLLLEAIRQQCFWAVNFWGPTWGKQSRSLHI